jgi:hypothetical protein
MSFTLGHIDRNITFMQSPPILAWTPYQMLREASCQHEPIEVCFDLSSRYDRHMTYHAITPLLKTHHRLPQMPKEARATTGNVIWKTAPGRELATINGATMPYPAQTQSHACHHERPSCIIDDAIIHLSLE